VRSASSYAIFWHYVLSGSSSETRLPSLCNISYINVALTSVVFQVESTGYA